LSIAAMNSFFAMLSSVVHETFDTIADINQFRQQNHTLPMEQQSRGMTRSLDI
jgi:hypothetical protein